jgi:predicted AlkP superfamily pyrophosphatase or phosphodiesterase
VLKKMLAAAFLIGLIGATISAPARANDIGGSDKQFKHVLLISVDGLHALDVANHVAAHPDSALAELSEHAVTYSNARTPANSDSFPGLLAVSPTPMSG